MKVKIKYNHSTQFYEEKWQELQQWSKKYKVELPYKNRWQFQQDYYTTQLEGSKNVMREIKYGLRWNTEMKTARAELGFLEEANIEHNLKLKDLKIMTPQEFYEMFYNEIESYRNDMKTLGINSYHINQLIALHFFGSN